MNQKQRDDGPLESDYPVRVEARDGRLWVTLADERIISTPLEWYVTLSHAKPSELANYELSPAGIYSPDLDEDLSVEGLLRGRRPNWPKTVSEWHEHLDEIRREREEAAEWMTPPQVADFFGISRYTVNSAIRRKRIPAHKSGGTWLLKRSDAEGLWGSRHTSGR